jgi:hypothetical protein
MPAIRSIPPPVRTPYSSTGKRGLDRAATMLLRIANSPSPTVVQSTVAEREILNRSSTIARPDRGAAFWARIAGLGSESDEYRPLRESYSRDYDHDPLFLAMDLAFGAVCIYKGLQAKYPSSSLAAVVRGKSHEEHLLETVHAIERQSWAFYRVHRAWNSEETLDLAGRTVLLRLLVRSRVVSAVVNTLGRSYRPAQAASQDLINKLMIQLARPSPSTPNVESEMTIRPRIDAQTVDGNDEMAPSSPTVVTTDPGPGFRNALDRRIRSLRDPSRTARHLPNVPSSLVDPGSPRQQLAVGNIPSSSPVQVFREDPQSSESPTPTRSRQVHARSLSEDESTIGADDNRAHSPSSSPPLEELPPHQGASPIAPSGSDWPTDNGDDEMYSIFAENGTIRSVVESPGQATRRALSTEYEDRVAVYGVPRYQYLLAHPHHPTWDEIIPRRTPPVLRMHPREARRYWAMPVDENEVEEVNWWEI